MLMLFPKKQAVPYTDELAKENVPRRAVFPYRLPVQPNIKTPLGKIVDADIPHDPVAANPGPH